MGGVNYVATSATIFELDTSVLVSFKSLEMVSVNYITVRFARVFRLWRRVHTNGGKAYLEYVRNHL